MENERYRLSPYCVFWMDPDGRVAQVVNGRYGSRFSLEAELMSLLIEHSAGAALDDLITAAPEGASAAIMMLVDEQVLVSVRDADEWAATDPFCDRLQPLELAFHRGVNEGGYFAGDVDVTSIPPPVKQTRGGVMLALETHGGVVEDAPLARCLARRRSLRSFGTRPLSRARFERFLELSCRAYALREVAALGWVSSRHYPSAGARYPLEIYPVIYRIDGLPNGIYHYRPFAHSIESIGSDRAHRDKLLEAALHRMAPVSGQPAVMFIVTAVFARTCWKYRGMPYQAILMETGALYQTMYLAATSLGLAPCAVGAFPELATADILGIDSRDEAQIGLFALGSDDAVSAPSATVVALRRNEVSPFAGGTVGSALELTFSDGTRQIVPMSELSFERDGAGSLRLRYVHRGDIVDIADDCRADALRLLEGRNRDNH